MKHLIASVILALATSLAQAATIYISACDAGAHPSCVVGTGDGSSPANARATIPSPLVAGDVYRLARGSRINDARWTLLTVFGWTMEDYTPTWCTGDCATNPEWRPQLKNQTGADIFTVDAQTSAAGFTLRNLRLIGDADVTRDGKGVYLSPNGDIKNVMIVGSQITNFSIGVEVSSGYLGGHRGFKLMQSQVTNNITQGFLGSASGGLIERSTFSNNGESLRDHNIYVSRYANGFVVRGNTLSGAGGVLDGVCRAVSLLAHGTLPNLQIENNDILETNAAGGCVGIMPDSNTTSSNVPQDFTGLIVRGNRVVMSGLSTMTGIGCSSCPGAVIENNMIVRESPSSGTTVCINVPSSSVFRPVTSSWPLGRPDVADTYVIIRNNTCHINTSSTSSVGINLRLTAGGDVVSSNVISYGALAPSGADCFLLNGRGPGTFATFEANTCWRSGGALNWSDSHALVVDAVAAGFANSNLSANPGVTLPESGNGWILAPSAGSALIDAAHAGTASRYGYRGKPRNGARDRGACEYRTGDACSAATASIPSSPTNTR